MKQPDNNAGKDTNGGAQKPIDVTNVVPSPSNSVKPDHPVLMTESFHGDAGEKAVNVPTPTIEIRNPDKK